MSADAHFTRDNLDKFLNELAKQFKKINGKYATAELILIGGAAVLVNYDFRNMTNDIDAIINSTASLKEAINIVGDKFSLPNFWLNSDFTRTSSYSPKLTEVSKYYKTFSNVISVRTVTGEYLIAMKLISGRQYKNDISDIIGIVHEEREQGREITAENVKDAVCYLYGSDTWEKLSDDSKILLGNIFGSGKLFELYNRSKIQEQENRKMLTSFQEKYPNTLTGDNINDVLKNLKSRKR